METWIILLRGINVGGHHIVPMKELRQMMEDDGFQSVATYIQSGNVVCQYPENPSNRVTQLIEQKFGFAPSSFVLKSSELRHIANNNPFPKDAGKAVHFFLFQEEPANIDFELMDSLKAETEEYSLIDKVFYFYAPDGIGRSKLIAKIDRIFSKAEMTARNLNTINKLLNMVEQ